MDKNFPRLLDTLRLIPRSRKASTAEIHRQLTALGHAVTRRTVQRDLEALSLEYGFECDDRDKTYGWRWAGKVPNPLVPEIDFPQALALLMLERELGPLVPQAAREALSPWLAQARGKVVAKGHAKASRWLKKVVLQPLGPPLLPAKVQQAVQDAVIEALFAEVQIAAEYRGAQSNSFGKVRLHPLGLIHTGLVTYLAARYDGYDDVRLLAMHRLRRVKVIDAAADTPVGFDLAQYVRDGGLNFGDGPTVKLRLRMTHEAAMHLRDTPLSRDQTIMLSPRKPGDVIVTATVQDSPRLEWWIRGFGKQVRRMNR